MANRAQTKGKKGEQEAMKFLLDVLPITDIPSANMVRLRSIGDDLELLHFSIEVKRRESLDVPAWWRQCVVNADKKCKEPVLMFRQNRKPWRFVISARYLGLSKGYIELGRTAFIEFMTDNINNQHKPYAQVQ